MIIVDFCNIVTSFVEAIFILAKMSNNDFTYRNRGNKRRIFFRNMWDIICYSGSKNVHYVHVGITKYSIFALIQQSSEEEFLWQSTQ
jgi:hypothetical protein